MAISLISCNSSFEEKLGVVNVGEKNPAVFSIELRANSGIVSKDILLNFTDCKGGAEIVLENTGETAFEVSYSVLEKGKEVAKISKLVLGGTVKFPLKIKSLIGFSIIGFSDKKSKIRMIVKLNQKQKKGAELSARAVWADGP